MRGFFAGFFMKKICLSVCLSVFAVCPQLSEAGFFSNLPRLPEKGKPVSLQLQTEYYRTSGNYKTPKNFWMIFGEYDDLSDKNELWSLRLDPSVSYSPYRWLTLDLFLHTLWVNTQTGGRPRDLYQPVAAGGGFTAYKRLKSSYLAFEFKGGAPLIKIPPNTDDVVAGDGAYFAEPGLRFIFQPRSRIFYLFYSARFRYRTNGLSSLLFNTAGGVLKTDLADIGASADVFMPVISDIYSLRAEERWRITDRVNGGSYKFFSVDPRAVSFNIWTNWNFFKPHRFTVYASFDTSGQNYARGLALGAIASIQWKTGKGRRESSRKSLEALGLEYEEAEEDEDKPRGGKDEYFEEESDPQSPFADKELKRELRRLR